MVRRKKKYKRKVKFYFRNEIPQKTMYDANYKIILFGDIGVGKSTLLKGVTSKIFEEDTSMTLGVDVRKKILEIDGRIIKLQIWSFKGEAKYRYLFPSYVKGGHGGIFIYDITNYITLVHIDEWLKLIREKIDDLFPIVVIGSKADLVEQRKISREEALQVTKSRGLDGFLEYSAKTGENMEKIFESITRIMLQRSEQNLEPSQLLKLIKSLKKILQIIEEGCTGLDIVDEIERMPWFIRDLFCHDFHFNGFYWLNIKIPRSYRNQLFTHQIPNGYIPPVPTELNPYDMFMEDLRKKIITLRAESEHKMHKFPLF